MPRNSRSPYVWRPLAQHKKQSDPDICSSPVPLLSGVEDKIESVEFEEREVDVMGVSFESDSDEDESQEEYLAPMEDPSQSVFAHYTTNIQEPFTSENHKTTLLPGELLVGGMHKRQKTIKRKKQREARTKAISNVTVRNSAFPLPPEYIAELRYVRTTTLTSATPYAPQKSQVNNAFDCFMTGSGTNTNQLTPFRDYYFNELVLGFKHKYEIVNNEAFSQLVLQRYTNTDIGTPTTTAEQRYNGAFSRSCLLPGTGSQNKLIMSATRTIPQIVGNKECLWKETFIGSSTAGPTDLVWSNLLFVGAGNQTNGVRVTETLSLRIKFSGLIADTETFDASMRPSRVHGVSDSDDDRIRQAKDKIAVLLSELHSPQ